MKIASRILKNWIKLAKLKEIRRHKTVLNVNVKIYFCLPKDTVLDVYGKKDVHTAPLTLSHDCRWC